MFLHRQRHRQSSNYGVGKDGRIAMYVEEKERTGHGSTVTLKMITEL